MIASICLIVLCLVLLLSWLSFLRDTWRINVDGPMPLPLIGNAHMFMSDTSKFMNILHGLKIKYGNAYRIHLLNSAYVVLSHPKYIEPLVSSSELIRKGRSYIFLKEWLGDGLLTSSGQRWKLHRKFLTPAFHFNILQNFLSVFCKNSRVYADKLRDMADGSPIDLFPITALAALDNVTETIMGVSVNAQKNNKSDYVRAIEEMTQIMALRIQIPFLSVGFIFKMSPFKRRQDKALKILNKQTTTVINARREDLKKSNITTLNSNEDMGIKNRYAFLDLLLLAEIDGQKMKDEHVKEEVDTFMFEGHDTTTSGIVFSLFCLSKYPDIQEKIYDEQKSIFGDDMDRDPTYNEVQQMKYLEICIKECMRIYPPVPMIERLMHRDVELGDLKMREGTLVLVNIIEMQRNPEVFEDPLAFKPERFESTEQTGRNPFSWLAFSAGPRNCIGQRFAMMELKVALSSVMRKLKLLPVDKEPTLCSDLVLRSSNGVYIRALPRK